MKQIAMVFLFDRHGRLLIYLRDNKPEIPFPNHWDFFGGHIEEGETPEQALVREVREELGIELQQWNLFRIYECEEGDAYPNLKYVYWAKIDKIGPELTLYEGTPAHEHQSGATQRREVRKHSRPDSRGIY
jgi:8-oxo-dGTP diphosphatase